MIIVKNSRTVLVDGSNYGAVADTIANNAKLASEVQLALQNYEALLLAQIATAKKDTADAMAMSDADKQVAVEQAAKELQAALDKHAAEVAVAQEAADAEKARLQAVADDAAAKQAEAEKIATEARAEADALAALTEEEFAAKKIEDAKSADQKEREYLTEQISELQARLDALGKVE